MKKRAALVALGVVVAVFVVWPLLFLRDPDAGNTMTPPGGEIAMLGVSAVLVFGLAYLGAYLVLRRRSRPRASGQTRANR